MGKGRKGKEKNQRDPKGSFLLQKRRKTTPQAAGRTPKQRETSRLAGEKRIIGLAPGTIRGDARSQ